jgi:hypothetical protein
MLNSGESPIAAPSAAMAKREQQATNPERAEIIPGQADRLRLLWRSYDFQTASAFAAFLGIPVTTYNSFENGAPLSRGAVFKIVQKMPGITSDWLYFDNPGGLSLSAARRLGLLGDTKRKT